jgi:hypothetical protein
VTAPRGQAVGAKPLYLEADKPVRVSLDCSALRIDADAKAGIYVPLTRVSRIIACPRTEFTTEAFLACAERGITVLLHDDEGDTVARLIGRAGPRQEFHRRLREFILRPDWRELYASWDAAAQRWLADVVRQKLKLPAELDGPRAVRERIDQLATGLSDVGTARRTGRWFYELSLSAMLAHCRDLGIGGDSETFHDGHPDLIADLGRLLAFRIEPARVGWLLRRRQAGAGRRDVSGVPVQRRHAVDVFESRPGRISRFAHDITNRLHRWLIDIQ